ncbi:hypothetical protein GGI15_004885 [Coemansia interrupta]|uniref:Short-chain dehydrogenase/reductase n=1 Tax=Coemansia interrupta TaxID=1126814 RepID=A0A9W8H6T7_9FUNG|nr:hypothetical protein GGI15_004885 [Coemansia interrupta]
MFWSKQSGYSVEGKVVILTGALGAIGRGLALRLVEKGASVALVDIGDEATGATFCSEINQRHGEAHVHYLKIDLRKEKDIIAMFERTEIVFGRIDVLINNAGVASPAKLYEDEEFDRIAGMLEINLRAPIETTRQFVNYIRENDSRRGVVVNMASMGGLLPNRGGEVYGALKAALIHLTRASKSLAPTVRVAAVAPYYVTTPMVLGNPKLQNGNKTVFPELMLDIDQVCRATVRCIEDEGSAGQTFALIGGWTYLRMWLFDFAGLHIRLLAGWSLLVARLLAMLGLK